MMMTCGNCVGGKGRWVRGSVVGSASWSVGPESLVGGGRISCLAV